MSRRIVVASLLVSAVYSPAAALQMEFRDNTTAATVILTDGGFGDDIGTPGVPDGIVGTTSTLSIGLFEFRDIQCREEISPGASAALIIEGLGPGQPGVLQNLATPSSGNAGTLHLDVQCRGSAIVPGIPDWRGRVHYVAQGDDDVGDELFLPTHRAFATANGGLDLLATVYGPPIEPPLPAAGQPLPWWVGSIEVTDALPQVDSLQLELEFFPRGRDRVQVEALQAVVSRSGLRCTKKKFDCVRKAVKGLLECRIRAEMTGTAVSQTCLDHFEDRFDGGAVPADGCFEQEELHNPPPAGCVTYDDTTDLLTRLNGFVSVILTTLGTPTQNKCAAKKKKCVSRLQDRLLRCHRLAHTTGLPVDIACVRTAVEKFTGGDVPSNGCFAKLEARYPAASATPCLTFGDTSSTLERVENFTTCVNQKLGDPTGASCQSLLQQGCGLPRCKDTAGQRPDCSYVPVVASPRYGTCRGPLVLVDRTHDNFHNVTPESTTYKGRYWGFANLLMEDGYDVRDSTELFETLLTSPTFPDILVIANPRASGVPEALSAADVTRVVNWVDQGGSLLLVIDHPPYNKVGSLLQAFGLQRFATNSDDPSCTSSLCTQCSAACRHFTRASGSLNPSSVIANGFAAGEDIDDVFTFFGTFVALVPSPPATATYEGVLTFPTGTFAHGIDISGFWQGVAIEYGLGRVYVAAEAGSLTAQSSFSMEGTPDNEQYVLNIIHWLD